MCNIDKSVKSHQKECNPTVQLAALAELLKDDEIELICRQLGHKWRDRIFTPAVTVRSMVHRALNPDKSIRSTLVDLAVLDNRLRQTPADASWCQARSRLPSELWPQLLQRSIKRLQQSQSGRCSYQKRPVYLIDGSTLSMPDSPELAQHFGYFCTKNGPSRFPVARLTLIILAGLDGVWDYRLDHFRTSEDAQLHQMWGNLPSGSICIFDRQFSSFYNLAKLQQRGIGTIVPLHQARDPQKLLSHGKPIGTNQWIVELNLRQQRHKKYNDPTLPKQLPVRLIRLPFLHHGKPKLTWLVTTLLNPNRYPQTDIMKLYRDRWGIETRLGELKTTLQMNILRSKGSQAACYEVASTILGYNLLRTVIHQAAKQNRVPADRISFATAIKMILAYSMSLRIANPTQRQSIYNQMLHDIARYCNPLRPGRVEPRRIKRNDGQYPYLSIPRDLARKKCLS